MRVAPSALTCSLSVLHQARFANARLATEQHDLTRALLLACSQRSSQQPEFLALGPPAASSLS